MQTLGIIAFWLWVAVTLAWVANALWPHAIPAAARRRRSAARLRGGMLAQQWIRDIHGRELERRGSSTRSSAQALSVRQIEAAWKTPGRV